MMKFPLARQLWALFSRRDRASVVLILILDFFGALLELVGIGVIVPFILFLSSPEAANANRYTRMLRDLAPKLTDQQFLLLGAGATVLFFLFKNAYLPTVFHFRQHFIRRKYMALSETLFANYLHQPYAEFRRRPEAELLRNIQFTRDALFGVLIPAFNILTELLTVGVLLAALFWFEPLKAFVFCSLFGFALLLFLRLQRKSVRRIGERLTEVNLELITDVQRGLGSLRETRILGMEHEFLKRYAHTAADYSRVRILFDLAMVLPRFVIESLAVFFLMGALMLLLWLGTPNAELIAGLTALVLVAVRLMPAVTRVSMAVANLRGCLPMFNLVYNDWLRLNVTPPPEEGTPPPCPFMREFRFDNVAFSYADAAAPAVLNVSFAFHPGETIGIVGGSGAGKSTVLDLLLGLLEPQAGSITLDGRPIAENLRAWRRRIGWVPQRIFLFDDTIRRNIALGVPDGQIDEKALMRALQLAELDGVISRLPLGLDTRIGDGGGLLSGGERQRVGIARALYRDPAILILDEATAALDNLTERRFVERLRALPESRTVLMIAHRLSTVEHCDRILLFHRGALLATGTYGELLEKSTEFRELATAPEQN